MNRLLRLVAGRSLPRRSPPTTVVECRRCGTTLDDGAETCLRCESGNVARYEIR